jgi:hypothetical protein
MKLFIHFEQKLNNHGNDDVNNDDGDDNLH